MISFFKNLKSPVNELSAQFIRKNKDKKNKEYLESFKAKVEKALLSNPSVEDCAVLIRETATCQLELVAYFVSTLPISSEQIQSQLQEIASKDLLPKAYVPVSTIPLTNTGQVDEPALAKLAVIDSDLIDSIEEQLELQSEIDRVAVVVEPLVKDNPPLHLDDLLPGTQAVSVAGYTKTLEGIQTQAQGSILSQKIENTSLPESKNLAICHGEPLQYQQDAPKTLAEVLQRAAQQSTKGILYIQSDGFEKFQSYQSLVRDAERIMGGLRKLGLKPQDKVIFQLSQNFDIISAFWGCIFGGFIPVIIAPPRSYEENNQVVNKICHVWQLLEEPFILTTQALQRDVKLLNQWLPDKTLNIASIEELRINPSDSDYHLSKPDDIAFLNLTSGSTGMPKCIALTHRNLISRARGANILCKYKQEDIILNWLPFDHIGSISDWHIRCIELGCHLVYVQTEYILSRPLSWLDLIDKFRITHSWSPNFAYSLINDALKQQKANNWNLDCVEFFLTAGEAVSNKATVEFIEQLHAKYKLKKTALHPAFGMAEMGSGITYYQPTEEKPLNFYTVDKSSLKGKLKRVEMDHPQGITFTDLGPVIPGVSIRIVDDENSLLPEDTIGRLQVKGDAVSPGYYRNSEATKEAFLDSGWFDTGDLGFINNGHLVITGRAKETIIINGVNYYSHEIEAAVEEIEGVEISYTAACAVRSKDSNTDKLAIFFNSKFTDDEDLASLIKEIRAQVVNKLGLSPDYLIPVDKEIIPKTAIGKIQRSQLSQRFNAGEFKPILKQVDILLRNNNTIPDWFHRVVWKPKSPVTIDFSEPLTTFTLVFLDLFGLGAHLCQVLSQHNQPYITVLPGEDFQQISRDRYIISPEKADHYHLLLKSLAADNIVIGQILHLWTYNESIREVSNVKALEQAQEQGIYSLLFLVQALTKVQGSDYGVKLLFISTYIQSLLPTDPIAYEKATVLGLLKTIPQELPWLKCRHIDLPFEQAETNGAYILQELFVSSKEREVAYRNGQRFVPHLEKVDLPSQPRHLIPFKQGGTYLLTGGLGGVGIQIAQYLLKHYQARLLLVGRTSLPEKSVWNSYLGQEDTISQRLKAYQELEQLGGEVIYETVDICDEKQLVTAVEKAKVRWGNNLDGVIHLAGNFHEQLVLEETQESLIEILRPKVFGAWALHQLIKDNKGSIFINFSSAHGFFGSTAVGAYAAANSFLDSFSHYQNSYSELTSYCMSWSMWDETGMSQGYQIKNLLRTKGFYAMPPSQAISSMIAALHHKCSHLFIGLDGSKPNIQRWQPEVEEVQKLTGYFTASSSSVVKLPVLKVQDRFGTVCACNLVQLSEMPLKDSGAIDKDKLVRRFTHQEASKNVAPQSEIERQIAQIWQQVLGIPILTVHDSFFELGGNSLLAMQLISRLRDAFSVELSLHRLFTSPSVADLALNLEALQATSEGKNSFPTDTEEAYEEGYL